MIRRLYNWLVADEVVCSNCELLKSQLELANYEKKQLLTSLLEVVHPKVITEETPLADYKPITTGSTPWKIRRELLEKEDREKARLLKIREDTDNLEEELEKIAAKNDELVRSQNG